MKCSTPHIAWAPDGRRLASGSKDGMVQLWDPAAGTLVAVLTGHTDPVTALAWAPDSGPLATAGEDTTVRLWDGRDGAPLATFEGHTGAIRTAVWSRDGAGIGRPILLLSSVTAGPGVPLSVKHGVDVLRVTTMDDPPVGVPQDPGHEGVHDRAAGL